jgi:hypothetical protein
MARCALVREQEQDPAQCNGVNGHRLGSKTERARGAHVDIQPRVLVIDADAAMFSSVARWKGFDVRTAADVDGCGAAVPIGTSISCSSTHAVTIAQRLTP